MMFTFFSQNKIERNMYIWIVADMFEMFESPEHRFVNDESSSDDIFSFDFASIYTLSNFCHYFCLQELPELCDGRDEGPNEGHAKGHLHLHSHCVRHLRHG